MLGYLSVNGTLTFKKSYEDANYYDLDYFAQHTRKIKGCDKLICKKGKGSRLFRMNRRARKRIENATLLMRHLQSHETHAIKLLTLTFARKHKNANKCVSRYFNRLMNEGIIENYWWVKEYHPEHYKKTSITLANKTGILCGEKKEHYHCLVSLQRYTTKIKLLELWQLQAGIDTIIIDLKNIRVRNKYNSFSYQIVRYVSKYCTKSIDTFRDRVYGMSENLSKQNNIPIIYAKTIKNLLQNISQNEDLTENEIIYYREYWNQAYLKVKQAETYFKIKDEMEKDSLWRWLYLDARPFEVERPKQAVKKRRKLPKDLEINFKDSILCNSL